MKKKVLLLFVFFIVCSCVLFSASNLQKYFLKTDDVWSRVAHLARSVGQLGPVPVSPATGYQILQALESIDYELLTEPQKAEWDDIYAYLTGYDSLGSMAMSDDWAVVDFNIGLNYEVYPHNNIESTYVDEYFLQFKDRLPLLTLGFDALFGNSLAFTFEYRFQDTPMGFGLWDDGSLNSGDLFYHFHNASILFSPGLDGKMHYLANWSTRNVGYNFFNSQPVDVGASLSNEYMSLIFGRTRHSFGNGITGNMVIGDNFTYQELLQFSAFSSVFNYTLSLTHFDNTEYFDDFGSGYGTVLSGYHQNRLIHRFDVTIANTVRISANIGALFLTDSPFDLRLLNPMMVVHNWGNNKEQVPITLGDESNNIMGLELEWAICNNLVFTGQFVVDQMTVHGENDSSVPLAIGGLANIKYSIPLEDGAYVDTYGEVVYTSPYLYLNTKTLTVEDKDIGGMLDYIVGYGFKDNRSIESNYSGHSFGPDTFAFCIGAKYETFDKWSANGSILFKMHGENGIKRDYWSKQDDSNRSGDEVLGLTGTPEYTLRIDAGFGYDFTSTVSLSVQTANFFQWNYHNVSGEFKYSFQAAVGLSWAIF